MARSLSNAKLVSSFVADRISVFAARRGYAAASQGVVSGSVSGSAGRSAVMGKKVVEDSTKTSSWVPDPVTGYYRPENRAGEIDVADLREMLLNNKVRRN